MDDWAAVTRGLPDFICSFFMSFLFLCLLTAMDSMECRFVLLRLDAAVSITFNLVFIQGLNEHIPFGSMVHSNIRVTEIPSTS